METVSISPLATLRPSLQWCLYEARAASRTGLDPVSRSASGGQAAPYPLARSRCAPCRPPRGSLPCTGETVQMVCHQFLSNVETARELRQTNRQIRSPYKDKRFFPLSWPAQAVSVERGRIVVPMGRGSPSLVFKLELPERIGGCKLVCEDGYELHVSVPVSPAATARGQAQVTVDLGEIRPAGGDHQYGGSAGGVWARDAVAQTAAPHGTWTTGQKTQALYAWLAAVAQVGGRTAQGERRHSAAGPGASATKGPAR